MTDDVVKSVGRVFEIMEMFDEVQAPLSATQIARALDLPQSSVVAVLKSMTTLGYLAFDKLDRRYLPTVRLALLGQWLVESIGLDGHLMHLINDISTATQETVALSVQSDLYSQFLRVEPGRKPLTLSVKAGDKLPLLQSINGLVALSGRSDADIRNYIERANRQTRDAADRGDPATVLDTINAFRAQGYGYGGGQATRGTAAVAWLLPALPGGRRTVLSVAGAEASIAEFKDEIVETVTALLKAHLDV